ncbi:archease [bacterium]
MTKIYEKIEHTSDIGLRIFGSTLDELFVHAVHGVYDLAQIKGKESCIEQQEHISIHGHDIEALLINLLNEIIFKLYTKKVTYKNIYISIQGKDKDKVLNFKAETELFKSIDCETEIKAATYHNIKVKKQGNIFTAEVIFDV